VKTGRGPAGVAVHPAGTRVYVSNYRNATLSVIDAASATVVSTVSVDDLPLGVAVHPAGTKVYVTSYRARNVDVVGTTSATVLSRVRVGRKPVGVAFDASGGRAFVASSGDDVLVVLDTGADAVTAKIPVGKLPLGVAVDLTRDQPWVTEAEGDGLAVVGDSVDDVPMPRTPVAFGNFIGSPAGRCPARALRCDDADPFTSDGCGPTSGCEHTPLTGLDGVAAGVHALAETIASAPIGDGPLAQRLRVEVPALDGVIAAVQSGGGRDSERLAKRRLTSIVHLLERARKRDQLGPDGGRLLDLARETRRRLKLALRAR
jgi:YVTN family beta-propeller protein